MCKRFKKQQIVKNLAISTSLKEPPRWRFLIKKGHVWIKEDAW